MSIPIAKIALRAEQDQLPSELNKTFWIPALQAAVLRGKWYAYEPMADHLVAYDPNRARRPEAVWTEWSI